MAKAKMNCVTLMRREQTVIIKFRYDLQMTDLEDLDRTADVNVRE